MVLRIAVWLGMRLSRAASSLIIRLSGQAPNLSPQLSSNLRRLSRISPMKAKKPRIILGCLAAVVLGAWFFRVHLVLACAPFLQGKGESGGQWLRDRLISCGSSAIGPTIATLRRQSPWTRNFAYLPLALRHFGEPAHQQLLAAIDAEADAQARAYLISALHTGFKDYTRFDRWLADRASISQWALVHMARDIQLGFPDAPPLQTSHTFNPDFIGWWEEHKSQ